MIALKERMGDTICAPATVVGSGAISLIRLSGPDALRIADCVLGGVLKDAPGYSVRYAVVKNPEGGVLDEVLASVFRAPHSYTGEDSVEISCHASSYIVEQLLLMLNEAGARNAAPGEFTRRAFVNGKMDLAQAEAVADVISSQNETAHRIAMKQMRGGFSKELAGMREQLLKAVSLMELELDFSEEDVEFADREQLMELCVSLRDHLQRLADSFRQGNAIRNGLPVAIVGATNAGKSTLLNTLLGEQRAIVSDVHGTTRDTVEECMNIDGLSFRFIDTAGIRESAGAVERIGIERTFAKLESASVVLAVMDISSPARRLAESLKAVVSRMDMSVQKLALLMNKADLYSSAEQGSFSAELLTRLSRLYESFQGVLPEGMVVVRDIPVVALSAKYSFGMDELRSVLADFHRSILSNPEQTMVTNLRHAEALRAAHGALCRVCEGIADGIPTDLLSQDIREAIYHLGDIVGEISSEEVLGNIFRNFCIGK